MSLDIYFKATHKMLCPNCKTHVTSEVIDEVGSSGKVWYDILESLGYYVPYDQLTEENDWYGKDMTLTPTQAKEVYQYVKKNFYDVYYGDEVLGLLVRAIVEEHDIVVNANW